MIVVAQPAHRNGARRMLARHPLRVFYMMILAPRAHASFTLMLQTCGRIIMHRVPYALLLISWATRPLFTYRRLALGGTAFAFKLPLAPRTCAKVHFITHTHTHVPSVLKLWEGRGGSDYMRECAIPCKNCNTVKYNLFGGIFHLTLPPWWLQPPAASRLQPLLITCVIALGHGAPGLWDAPLGIV